MRRFWDRDIFGANRNRGTGSDVDVILNPEDRFRQMLSRNGPALMRLAASYAATPSDRDDLFQEIVLALWQALPRFREECSERTFLFRIAHNRAMSHLAIRRPVAFEDDALELPDPRPNPESGLLQHQKGQHLLEAIQQLPLAYRQVISLTLEEMNYTEIADILGISEGNVGARLTRARQMLRRLLEDQQ